MKTTPSATPAIRRVARYSLALTLGLVTTSMQLGCTTETVDDASVDVDVTDLAPNIYEGERDDDDDALDGVVALRVGMGTSFELCTGALIAPNVVLTARHCLTRNSTTRVSCDENGRSHEKSHIDGDEAPETIGVYGGSAASFSDAPLAFGKSIVGPGGSLLCDADIGLLVLDRALTLTPLPVRREPAKTGGETVRSVGYGQNDKNAPIGTRLRKQHVPVLAQGKTISRSRTRLGAHELELGLASCHGDSGGPAIAEDSGAIIGVASRGPGCSDDHGHVYTSTVGFDAMFEEAFRLAGGGAPMLEIKSPEMLAREEAAEQDDEATPALAGCAVSTGGSGRGAFAAFGLGALLFAACVRRRAGRSAGQGASP